MRTLQLGAISFLVFSNFLNTTSDLKRASIKSMILVRFDWKLRKHLKWLCFRIVMLCRSRITGRFRDMSTDECSSAIEQKVLVPNKQKYNYHNTCNAMCDWALFDIHFHTSLPAPIPQRITSAHCGQSTPS